MKVVPVRCLGDNFAYLVLCSKTGEAAVVDPSEADPILGKIRRLGLNVSAIFCTHHHLDHVGGNRGLLKHLPGLKVYGHASDRGRIPGQTEFLEDGDPVRLGRLQGRVLHCPGHTLGSLTYVFEKTAFTGDTLFSAGCGRLFEGSAEDMISSLLDKIGTCPKSTKIYFGHEYTETNLKFAKTVEPGNPHIEAKLKSVVEVCHSGHVTTPTTLADEFTFNPFLRCDADEIKKTVRKVDPKNDLSPVSVFRVIRKLKDEF